MTGDNYNSNMKKGQVLLILVMLLATALTVALTASYQSVTETQLTKLEEENQKALAAAEAAIEKALSLKQGGTFNTLGLSGLSGIDLYQSSVEISNQGSNSFISPLLQKDEQYTFYLAPYNPQTKSFPTGSTQQNINICFGSSTSNPALEITLIKNNSIIRKYAINPKDSTIITNAPQASNPTNCPDSNFTNQYQIAAADISTDTFLLIARVIGNGSTRIGFKAGSNFPLQGSTITSTAKSTAGVQKKVQLFQSYPQIPAEFFVTSF